MLSTIVEPISRARRKSYWVPSTGVAETGSPRASDWMTVCPGTSRVNESIVGVPSVRYGWKPHP